MKQNIILSQKTAFEAAKDYANTYDKAEEFAQLVNELLQSGYVMRLAIQEAFEELQIDYYIETEYE